MVETILPRTLCKCKRCGWEWFTKAGMTSLPKMCAHCGSPYWDRERKTPAKAAIPVIEECVYTSSETSGTDFEA